MDAQRLSPKHSEILKNLSYVIDNVGVGLEGDAWVIHARNLSTKNSLPDGWNRGPSLEAALESAWFWLTSDYRAVGATGRLGGPSERACVIKKWGDYEIWWRWEKEAWRIVTLQPREGHRFYDLEDRLAVSEQRVRDLEKKLADMLLERQ